MPRHCTVYFICSFDVGVDVAVEMDLNVITGIGMKIMSDSVRFLCLSSTSNHLMI